MEEDMEMRQAALDSVKIAAEELLKQAGNDQDEAVRGKHAQMLICCFCCANTKYNDIGESEHPFSNEP